MAPSFMNHMFGRPRGKNSVAGYLLPLGKRQSSRSIESPRSFIIEVVRDFILGDVRQTILCICNPSLIRCGGWSFETNKVKSIDLLGSL